MKIEEVGARLLHMIGEIKTMKGGCPEFAPGLDDLRESVEALYERVCLSVGMTVISVVSLAPREHKS